MKYYLSALLIICGVWSLHAQRGYEVGGWLGASQYYGDLNTEVNFNRPGLAGGIIGKYNFDSRIAARLSFSVARLRGTDEGARNNFNRNRNLHFYSNIAELSLAAEFHFFEYLHSVPDYNYSPYLVGGYSLVRHTPMTKLDGMTYNLRKLGTEGQDENQEYGPIAGSFVLGLGFKWDLGNNINMGVEGMMHFTRTDYLDDVSKTYPDYDELEALRGAEAIRLANRTLNGVAGATGNQRGNSSNNDKYLYLSVVIMKYFGRIDCPRISKAEF